jgi:hypothetical protein
MDSVMQPSLIVDTKLWETKDFEGMLINPTDINKGLLVMSERDDTFTLHIYKLTLLDDNQYGNEKILATKSFTTAVAMDFFLQTFSTFQSDEFKDFLRKHDK